MLQVGLLRAPLLRQGRWLSLYGPTLADSKEKEKTDTKEKEKADTKEKAEEKNKPDPRLDPFYMIGTREVVGHGFNGQPVYEDDVTFPYPAIRFREIQPMYKALKEKERGDWRALTLSEKKCLYRISFCQTFSEMTAPTGEWKSIIGMGLIFISLSILLHLLVQYIVKKPLPDSFKLEHQQAQLKRMIDLRVGAVDGLSSKWDYDKNDWK